MKDAKTLRFIVLFSFLLSIASFSADTSALLLGHRWHDQNDLEKKTEAIFIGEFLYAGDESLDFPGRIDFHNAQVNIKQVLKGPLSGTIAASYYIESVIEKEETPQTKTDYIFFVKVEESTHLYIIKLLPATGDNVASVKSSIASEHSQ
jgi:hypothetical protein